MLAVELPPPPRRRRKREAAELRRGDEVLRAHQRQLSRQSKLRECLRCGRPFVSQHNGVRMCNGCRGVLGFASDNGHKVRPGRAGYGLGN